MSAALVLAAIDAGMQLINLAMKSGQHLQQSGEMSQAESDALDKKISDLANQPWWKPDAI
jgi:hypothetical protein